MYILKHILIGEILMKKSASQEIQVAGVILLFIGLLLLASLLRYSTSFVISVVYVNPTNTVFYNALTVFTLLFSIVYILVGLLLFSITKSKAVFWLGMILSAIVLLFNFPIGTILGVVNIYLLWKNKAAFYKTKKT